MTTPDNLRYAKYDAATVQVDNPKVQDPRTLTAVDSTGALVGLFGNRVTNSFLDIFDQQKVVDRHTLSLPNPYSALGSDLVHPAVVHVETGWQGWKFWMAYTPYPGSNSTYENPCLAVSQDGDNWTTPEGLVNPLVNTPQGGYNADTHLTLSPDGQTMYLIYRERISSGAPANNVRIMESRDGRRWTTPRTVLTGTYASQDYASPSVFWDAINSRWIMISHNLDGGATYPMQRNVTSGADIYSGWSGPTVISITNPTGGRTFWHSYFDILPSGKIVGLIQDIVNGGAGAAGALFAAESLDFGLTISVKLVYSDLSYYRPALSLISSSTGVSGIHAWIGKQSGTFSITREDWNGGADQATYNRSFLEYTISGNYPSAIKWFDNFNRADGAIGSPLVGSAAVVDTGAFTIVSNKLTSGVAANNRLLYTTASADGLIDVQTVSAGGQWWIIFRAVDSANYWRFGNPSGGTAVTQLQNIVGGSINSTTNYSTNAPGVRIRVVCRSRRFRLYIDGILQAEVTDTSGRHATGVKFGVQGDGSTAAAVFDTIIHLQ